MTGDSAHRIDAAGHDAAGHDAAGHDAAGHDAAGRGGQGRDIPSPRGIPDDLWARVVAARHLLLMLDYDGTLAPLQIHTEAAHARPRLLHLVERVAAAGAAARGPDRTGRGASQPAAGAHASPRDSAPRGSVAIISGRTLHDLERLVGRLPVILIGEHGWDERWPRRAPVLHPLSEAAAAGLRRAAAAATAAGFARHLERKRCAVILHTRGLVPDHAEEMARACATPWALEAARGDLRLDRIDGGVELRAAARDKGTAVRDLIAAAPPGVLAVCLGDDVSDEDAFREVAPHGFGLRVGPGNRPSLAAARLPVADDVEAFLAAWLAALKSPPAGRDRS